MPARPSFFRIDHECACAHEYGIYVYTYLYAVSRILGHSGELVQELERPSARFVCLISSLRAFRLDARTVTGCCVAHSISCL